MTVLKIVFGSPRFSEDLDFTGIGESKGYEKVLEETLFDLPKDRVVAEGVAPMLKQTVSWLRPIPAIRSRLAPPLPLLQGQTAILFLYRYLGAFHQCDYLYSHLEFCGGSF